MNGRLDPVTTEVIGRYVLAAAEEMGVTAQDTVGSTAVSNSFGAR